MQTAIGPPSSLAPAGSGTGSVTGIEPREAKDSPEPASSARSPTAIAEPGSPARTEAMPQKPLR